MKTLTLKLTDSSPNALSIRRIGDYLRELSNVLGEEGRVHFDSVTAGSCDLNTRIEPGRAYEQVLLNVREAARGLGGKRRVTSFRKLQEMMEEDGTGGVVLDDTSRQVVEILKPGQAEKEVIVLSEPGSVQGRLYRVGGKDNTVPIKIEGANGETYHCEAPTSLAAEMAHSLFATVRVTGQGTWERHEDTGWRLRKMQISAFQVLQQMPFDKVLADLRALGGLTWADMEDPHGVAENVRG